MRNKIGNITIEVEKKPKHDKEFAYFKQNFTRVSLKYNRFVDLFLNFKN